MTNFIMIKQGDIVLVDFGESYGSEQGGVRPAMIIQNNKGNFYSPTTQVVPITSEFKKPMITHVELQPEATGLIKKSTALIEQTRTIDKGRIIKRIGKADENVMRQVARALTASFSLVYNINMNSYQMAEMAYC